MKKASNSPAQSNRITKVNAANAREAYDAAKIAVDALTLPPVKGAQTGLPKVSAKSVRGVWKEEDEKLGLETQPTDELAYEAHSGDASAGVPSAAGADMVAQAAAAVATDAAAVATDAAASGAAAGASSAGAAAGTAGTAGAAGGLAGLGLSQAALVAVGAAATGLLVASNKSDVIPVEEKKTVPPALVDELTEVNVSDEATQGKPSIVLAFDQVLDTANAPTASAFVVKINNQVRGVEAVEISGKTLKLVLAGTLPAGSLDLSVSYKDPTSGNDLKAIQLADGTDAGSFELITGVVADGYIRGARVFVDRNKDGKFGSGDALVGTTDANGRFFVSKELSQSGDIVVDGGVNIDTGVPNTMVLKAPASSLVVNPLTTLVTAVMQTSKVDAAAAVQQVAKALNLVDADNKPLNLTSFDPIAKAIADPNDEVAVAAQKAAAKVASIVSLVVKANNDVGATAAASAAEKVISNLASTVSEAAKSSVPTTVDLSAAQVVSSALTGAVGAEKVEAVKAAVQASVTAIAAAEDLTAISYAQSQALDSIAPAKPTEIMVRAKTNDTTPAVEVVLPLKDDKGKWLSDGTAAVAGDTVVLSLGSNPDQTYVLKDSDIAVGKAILDWSASLTEGPYTIKARLLDRAGNTLESNFAQASFEIDLTLPSVTSTVLSMPENSTASTALTANESVTWLLGTGSDTSLFSLSNGALSFEQAQDFDTAVKTAFTVNVVATDVAGNVKNQAITVNLTNVNEVPAIALSASVIAENVTVGGGIAVGDLTVTDPDASGNNNELTLEGADADRFSIAGGKLMFTGSSPNYEEKNSYSVTVKSTDGALTLSQPFTINVTDVNEAPTAIALSSDTIAENVTVDSGVVIGTLSVTDPDATGNNNVLSIEPGADAAGFNVVDGNKLVFIGASPNFEAKSSYSITVKSTDSALSYSQTFTITVGDRNDAPTVANVIPDQIFVVGGAVDTFQFSANAFADQDAGTTLTYSATLENGEALPAWLSFNPANRTFSGNPPADGKISITVTASDGSGGSVSDTFKLESVTAPAVQGFSVTDATTANDATLGKAGEALTFTVTLSEAVTSTGALTATVNLNGTTVTATCAQVTDTNTLLFTGVTVPQGNNGSTITLTDITVVGVVGQLSNQQMVPLAAPIAQSTSAPYTVDTKTPTVTTLTVDLAENSTTGYALLADESVVWITGTGNDTDAFDLSGDGLLIFKTQRDYDTASQTLFTVNVVATDPAGNAKNQAVTVNLTNVNEAPVFASAPVIPDLTENTAVVGNAAATDPDAGDAITYSLGGPNASAFNIDTATGALSFKSSPNYELDAKTYSVVVTATDKSNLTATQALTINITDVVEKVEFRKGAVTSDLVTLEVWVDPGATIGSIDLQLALTDPSKYSVAVDETATALTFVRTEWSKLINEEAQGVYNIGLFGLPEIADPADPQKLLSIAVHRDQAADAIRFTLLSAELGETYTLIQPTDYIFSLV